MAEGRKYVPWATMAAVLVIARPREPSSELHVVEDWFRRTALSDILAVPEERLNDDRAPSALDCDPQLYDMTSTYSQQTTLCAAVTH
jgi:hypothetical protein